MEINIHTKKHIIPANYSFVLDYALATVSDGFPVPPLNVDEALKLMETKNFSSRGGLGKCSVCGAAFKYGSIWRHDNGEHIHIGHICEAKYNLWHDLEPFQVELERHRELARNAARRKILEADRKSFLESNPGLEELLDTDHYIISDIKSYFMSRGNLSEKQIELVKKICDDLKRKEEEPEEKKTEAQTGRISVKATVVGFKSYDGPYGSQFKMVVKVAGDDGIWTAFGTVPDAMLSFAHDQGTNARGCFLNKEINLTATFSASPEDKTFAYFKRPKVVL